MALTALSLFMAFFLPILLILVSMSTSLHSLKDREKISPFECGFDPMSSARIPFSMRFFLLAVIFLVFDIEIVLLMPLVLVSYSLITIFSLNIFILILLLGLIHEWSEGSLDWA